MAEVAVVGAGLMGHALALVFALGGHQVRLTDNDSETLARAPGLMATALATLSEAGEADARVARVMSGTIGIDVHNHVYLLGRASGRSHRVTFKNAIRVLGVVAVRSHHSPWSP